MNSFSAIEFLQAGFPLSLCATPEDREYLNISAKNELKAWRMAKLRYKHIPSITYSEMATGKLSKKWKKKNECWRAFSTAFKKLENILKNR